MFYRSCLVVGLAFSLSACSMLGKKKEPEAPPVVILPQEVKTCYEMSALTRVEVPAVTETYYAITEIENPPYEPIQRKQEMQREIEPARVIFTDSAGKQVTDICPAERVPAS